MVFKRDYETKECAIYNILGIRVDGRKEILELWIQDSESKHAWMQIFDELKSRGGQEVGFISMDGVTGLEEGARAIFPEVVVQRCIVHLIRNSLKYVPTRDYKDFTAHLKNSSFRKVTKRGTFPNYNSVFKLLYLRVVELQKKWADRPVANWSLVRNQLLLNDRISALFDKFDL